MPENKDKIKEIQENIQKWENELEEVWKDKNTDAAEVERRNLRNYIANARREIAELEGNKVEGQGKEEIKPEELLKDLKEEKETKAQADSKKNAEKNRIKLEIERLKEEREDYKNDKSIYEEYGKKIEELEGRLEDEKEEEKTQEQKDAQIKTLTQGRMNVEKEIQETEKEIRLKKREIEDVKFETEEIVLESGEKTKVPKVLGLYKELDKLEDKLRLQKNQKEEYQKAINELKGIEEKEIKDLNSEEIRYFHGQGDYREKTGEAGEDLRENRLGNDEYYRQGKSSRPIERVTTTPVEPKTEEDKKVVTEIEEEPKDQDVEIQKEGMENEKDTNENEEDLRQVLEQKLNNKTNTDKEKTVEPKVVSIYISEKDGKIHTVLNTGKEEKLDIKEAKKMKRKNFRELGIYSKCKELSYGISEYRMLKRRVNPEVIAAIKNDNDSIDKYIESLLDDKRFEFDLVHDLRGTETGIKGLINRIKNSAYVKYERRCGAKVIGEGYEKNNALPNARSQYQSETMMKKEKIAREQLENMKSKGIKTYEKAKDVPKVKKVELENGKTVYTTLDKEAAENYFRKRIEVDNSNNRIEKKAAESTTPSIDLESDFEKNAEKARAEFVQDALNGKRNEEVKITDKDGKVISTGRRIWSIGEEKNTDKEGEER